MELYQSKVTVAEMVRAMDICFRSGSTPVFIGESGIGKTQQIRYYSQSNGMGLVELNCGTLFVEDFGAIRDDGEFVEFKLNRIFDIKKPTLVFFDEFSRSRGDLRNAAMSIINERKIYGRRLSEFIRFAVAMNPSTQDYGDTDDPFVDLATTRRYAVMNVIHKAADWLAWARDNKIDERVIRFIRKNEMALLQGQACPRQWEKTSNILKNDEVAGFQIVGEGILGIVYRPFLEHLFEKKVITAEDVLRNYSRIRNEVKEDRELQMALSQELADKTLNKTHRVNVVAFMLDLAEEIRYNMIRTIVENKKDRAEQDMVYSWIDGNQTLQDFMENQSDYSSDK